MNIDTEYIAFIHPNKYLSFQTFLENEDNQEIEGHIQGVLDREKQERCVWEYDEHHCKYAAVTYHAVFTECNNGYWLEDGTLVETNIKYCPFCGYPRSIIGTI